MSSNSQSIIFDAKVPVQLTAVALSVVAILFASSFEGGSAGQLWMRIQRNILVKILCYLGLACYSIFIWHQVVFAFYRYIVHSTFILYDYIVVLVITALISVLSYRLIEGRIKGISPKKLLRVSLATFVVLNVAGLYVYNRDGVMRDIPELSIDASNIHRGMHAEYCDRVYKMDTPYRDNGKVKIFATGDSFIRDWINILLESEYRDEFDIVYVFGSKLSSSDADRIAQADYIFVNGYMQTKYKIPEVIRDNMKPGAKLIGVSTKAFGESNGNLYNRRNNPDYYHMLVPYRSVAEEYHREQDIWGEDFVDMMKPIEEKPGWIRAFTDDQKYISEDCRHLTQNGARYYSRILDIAQYTKKGSMQNVVGYPSVVNS